MTFDVFLGLFNQTKYQGNTVYAQVLYAQAYHETGGFKSSLFETANNLFGMRPSTKRNKYYDTVISNGSGDYAKYATVNYSLIDRLDLDSYNGVLIPTDVDDVLSYMNTVQSKGYATDPSYVAKWLKILQQLSSPDAIGGFSDSDDDDYDDIDDAPKSKKWVWVLLSIIVVLLLVPKTRNWLMSKIMPK